MTASQWANNAASSVAALAGLWCMWRYHRLAPWRSTSTGRHIMGFTGAVTALFLLTVVAVPGGTWLDIVRWMRAGIALVIAAFLMVRASMVARAQRQRVSDRMEGPDRL